MGIRGGSGFITGEQRIFAGDLPAGWLECNGDAVLRAAYPGLFGAIGTRYGVGDGVTTFNLPDKRGRGSISRGQGGGLSDRVQGAKHGAETVALSEAQLAVHTHSQNAHAHSITIDGDLAPENNITATHVNGSTVAGVGARTAASQANANTATNNNAGSGSGHSNMSPVEVDLWGIKF